MKSYLQRHWPIAIAILSLLLLYLWDQHRGHILGALPYLIILICPLMHIFMHRGHGQHHDRHDGDKPSTPHQPPDH
ncbi:MAG: DUF2933 domain-containing protein [Natronospirillum sp.]